MFSTSDALIEHSAICSFSTSATVNAAQEGGPYYNFDSCELSCIALHARCVALQFRHSSVLSLGSRELLYSDKLA